MENDSLGVLESTSFVISQSSHVSINRKKVSETARFWVEQAFRTPEWNEHYHFFDGTEGTVNYILVLDSLNFCFWGERTWRISYNGEIFSGYWALAASLKRALEEGIPIDDADFLASISENQLRYVFRGEGEIPLFRERLRNLRQLGMNLKERYESRFAKAVEEADHSAIRLAKALIQNFPSFNDIAIYKGQEARFYKRAQICVADLYGTFGGLDWGEFSDIAKLTAFADYRVPAVLRRLGILDYSPSLEEKIQNRSELPAGSEEEIEIRANTIWTVEYLKQEMEHLGKNVIPLEIDWYLWEMGGHGVHGEYPHHLTHTIFY